MYAGRNVKKGLAKENIPKLINVLKGGWYYFFAMIVMIYFIFMRQEAKAPFYAVALLLIFSMINKETRLNFKALQNSVIATGKLVSTVCATLLGVGFVVGSLSITGVAHSFSYEVVRISGNNLVLLLITGAMASFVLGMGMVASAAYLFLALTLSPALIRIGVTPLSAHMFVLYWGIISNITPPVALASMTAAKLADASDTKVGLTAMKLAMSIYIIPFAFVFNPALIGHGSIIEVAVSVLFAVLGLILMSTGLQGYFNKTGNLNIFWRCVLVFAGSLLFFNKFKSLVIGIVLGIITLIFNSFKVRKFVDYY